MHPIYGSLQAIAFRLLPGSDVRADLERWAQREAISAAVVIGAVGSLSQARLRFADQESGKTLPGKHEVLTLSGTLSTTGVHLHMMVADSTGHCTGGHVLVGCQVYTTLEIAIALMPDIQFDRPIDPTTGFNELRISSKNL